MSDNIVLNRGAGGDTVRSEDISGVQYVKIKLVDARPGETQPVGTAANPMHVQMPAVGGGLTNTELRASPVPVSGTFWQNTQPISGTIGVSGSVAVTGSFFQATQPVSAASLPLPTGAAAESTLSALNGKVTACNTGAVVISSGTVSVSGSVAVTGPLTDAQLRASAVKTREDTTVMTWASVKSAAPAGNSVQATTGALVAGDYDFDIQLVCSDTLAVGKGLVIEHRNAADAATVHNLGGCVAGGSIQIFLRRYTIATNERIRVIAGTAAGAASSMYISAIGRRVS